MKYGIYSWYDFLFIHIWTTILCCPEWWPYRACLMPQTRNECNCLQVSVTCLVLTKIVSLNHDFGIDIIQNFNHFNKLNYLLAPWSPLQHFSKFWDNKFVFLYKMRYTLGRYLSILNETYLFKTCFLIPMKYWYDFSGKNHENTLSISPNFEPTN